MTKKALIDPIVELQALGFGDYEARAYLALLKRSPATAYEVSKVAGIPKANAYSVLDGLAERRIVRPVSKSPMRYTPVPPDTLLSRIADQARQRTDRLMPELTRLTDANGEKDYVWPLEGEFEVSAKLRGMIADATQHLWIKASARHLRTHADALKDASERGVKVLVILFGNDTAEFSFNVNCTVYLHEGSGTLVGDAARLVTATRDFSEAMIATLDDDAYGSHTSSPLVVATVDTMIRHEIYMAEIYAMFATQIEATFGPSLFEIRKNVLPKHHVAAMREAFGQQPRKRLAKMGREERADDANEGGEDR